MTLVEVLVALALGTLILAALAVLFSRNSGNQAELERTSRMHENARFALDLITEDLMHAGYYGEFDPDPLYAPPPSATSLLEFSTPGPCPATATDLEWAAPAPAPSVAKLRVPTAVQGIAAATAIGCEAALADRQPNSQAISIRHAETTEPIAPAALAAGNLYIQVSRCPTEQTTTPFQVGSVSGTFTLRQPDCTNLNARINRAVQRTYYLSRCTDCAAGDTIPALRRIEWLNNARRDTPLAEGIENIQFEYGVDTNDDGQADTFVDVPGVTGAWPLVWQNVVAVRVHLLARATQPSPGYTDPRTYTLGAFAVTPGDNFKRILLTSTVRLLNVGGRRD